MRLWQLDAGVFRYLGKIKRPKRVRDAVAVEDLKFCFAGETYPLVFRVPKTLLALAFAPRRPPILIGPPTYPYTLTIDTADNANTTDTADTADSST